MASQLITLKPAQAKLLVKELMHIEETRKMLLTIIPESYFTRGSELWWVKSELEAHEDVKAGRVTKIQTHAELDTFLTNLR